MSDQLREMKAEPLDTSQLDRWLAGRIPRRVLVAPFGGPVKASVYGYADDEFGRDLDGEYFHPKTDFFGRIPAMRENRDRLTDWHHVTFAGNEDPAAGRMKGAVLARTVLDATPEADGLWADLWANVGEQRRALVAMLERRHVPLYNSTQPIKGAVKYGKAGAIDVWPIRYNTISTSPQNTLAVVPPLKALLADPNIADFSGTALMAALAESDDLDAYLAGTSATGQPSAKAGQVDQANLWAMAVEFAAFIRRRM